MILDEPFNGIENKTVEKLINYLKDEQKKGKMIIISTHIKDDLNKLTNRIIKFDNGNLVDYEEN